MLLGSSFAIANELNIYSYRKPFLLKPFLDEYSKKTNIKFNVLHLKKGMAQRLLSEGKKYKSRYNINSRYIKNNRIKRL
jgi:iron(III) transport system substrate-binding protein